VAEIAAVVVVVVVVVDAVEVAAAAEAATRQLFRPANYKSIRPRCDSVR